MPLKPYVIASPDKLAINSCYSDNQEGNHAFPLVADGIG